MGELASEVALLTKDEAERLSGEFEVASAQDVIAWTIERWGGSVAVCSSFQAAGMAILDIAHRVDPRVRVFTLDTGRLHQETYDTIEKVRERYGIVVEVLHPDASALEAMVTRWGPNLFYDSTEARKLCCQVRKVEPLARGLGDTGAWFTGLKRDDSAERANVPKIAIDSKHGGIAKIAPLADWSEAQLWDYVRGNDVPIHPLYGQGCASIGCQPCSRPTEPGEDSRAGRWWWEDAVKECGLHWASPADGSMESELRDLIG